jgi:SAM-dependent methyltransferase
MIQDSVFAEHEGNQWFERNSAALSHADRLRHDPVLRLIDLAGLMPVQVLEIGASNGYRLQTLHTTYGCAATAVEPSLAAINDGRARYPAIRFVQGVANDIPLAATERFDLVIVNFVLHWIDRTTLLRSVAEIDRLVQDGGYLIIGDFYPAAPERVPYHHLPQAGIWTYKQDYPQLFLASNLYALVAQHAFHHATQQFQADVAPNERAQVALLRKTLTAHYQSVALHTLDGTPPKAL